MRSRRVCCCAVGLLVLGLSVADRPSTLGQTPSGGALGRYVSPDFWGAVVIHPARVAKSPLWAGLPSKGAAAMPLSLFPGIGANETAALSQMVGSSVDKLRRIVVLLEGVPTAEAFAKNSPPVIIQFEEDLDPKLLQATGGEAGEYQGMRLIKIKAPTGQVFALCTPDPKVLLVSSEASLHKMLTPPSGPQPLLEELRRVSLDNDVMLAVVMEPLVKAAGPALPPQAKPIVEGMRSATATLNFTGDTLLHVDLIAIKEEIAMGLQMQLGALQALGTQQVQQMKANPPQMLAPVAGVLVPVLEEAVAGTKINKDALHITADMNMPSKLPELVKAAAMMAAAMGSMPPPAKPTEKSAK
jgi:hypothetical protein